VSSGVSSTITSRIRTGARDVLAQARAQAGDHKGVLAMLVGAIVLWFARGPILEWLDEFAEADTEDEFETADVASPEGDAQGDPA
jgi:predicted ATPase